MRLVLVIFLFFLFLPRLMAQTLTGTITDKEGLPISMANILIKEANQPQNILEFTRSKAGKFSLTLKKSYQNLRIDVTAFSHASDSVIVLNPHKDSTYFFQFKLTFIAQELKEVVVMSEKKLIDVKEDTVTYNVSAYRNGTEQKIEDVLKKMPGIKVNENSGTISYKGKEVETVTLEGDDLFGKNYAIGTKNINVDMVEQVQAIDNYSANPLLKGIEENGKVSLNLKLKKNKFDLSGSSNIGLGLATEQKTAISTNNTLLGITHSYKSFALLAFNNVGLNSTPFDHFGNIQTAERSKEMPYHAPKIIPEKTSSTPLADSRANVNKQYFASYNAVFKINKRWSIKNNLYFMKDDIYGYQYSKMAFAVDGFEFNFSDQTQTHKRPVMYRGDLEMKYNTSKTSLLEYNFRISQENIKTPIQTRLNDSLKFESRLNSQDFYLQQKLLFTQKIGKKRALQFHVLQSTNSVPQILTLTPSVLSPDTAHLDRQESQFQKNYIEAQCVLLGAIGRGKYTFSLGLRHDKNHYTSLLSSLFSNGKLGLGASNNLIYNQQAVYQTGVYKTHYKKWKLGVEYSVSYLYQQLQNESMPQNKQAFIIEPLLTIEYRLKKYSLFSLAAGYKQNPLAQNYLFSNEVLVDPRASIKNTPSLMLQNHRFYSINYYFSNMGKFFTLHTMATYSRLMGNFFTNWTFRERTTQLNNFFLPEPTDNLQLLFSIEQLFKEQLFKVDISSGYNVLSYKNILNGSQLRNNQSRNLHGKLDFTTIFNSPINFHNKLEYRQNLASTESISSTFKNESFTHSFTTIIRLIKGSYMAVTSDYYIPNLNKKNDAYWFLDAKIVYDPPKSKFNFMLTGKNLLNKKNFGQIQTSDYGFSMYQSNLLPRYVMLLVFFSF